MPTIKFLLNGDGSYTDTTADPITIYPQSGDSEISTAIKKFGSGSIRSMPTSPYPAWDTFEPTTGKLHTLFAGDFIMDMWVYTVADRTSGSQAAFEASLYDTVSESGKAVRISSITGAATGSSRWQAGVSVTTSATVDLLNGTWHHLCFSRVGSTGTFFANGAVIGTISIGAAWEPSTTEIVSISGGNKDTYFDDIAIWSGGISEAFFVPASARTGSDTVFSTLPPAETGNAALVAPMPTLIARGGSQARLVGSTPQLLAYGGITARLTASSARVVSLGRDSTGDNSFQYTAQPGIISAFGGANSTLALPSTTVSTTGTFVALGRAALSLSSPTIRANGTVSGTGRAALSVLTSFSLIGYSGAVCSVALSDKFTVGATGVSGGVGSAAVTLPLFELVATGSSVTTGQANLLMPAVRLGAAAQAWLAMPSATLTAIGSATVTVTYEAYALNLKHALPDAADELTRFTNYPFDKIIRYKNSYFGVNSTGLYLLEGTTDDAAPIAYHAKTKLTDFGTDQKKTPEAAIFGGRLGPDATVTVYTGETEDDVYAYTTPRGQDAQNYRQKFGKGLKARYYAFGIQGDGAMALDTVSFDIAKLKRRI